MKFEKRSGDEAETPSSAPEETPSTGKKPVVIYIMILFIVAFLLMALSIFRRFDARKKNRSIRMIWTVGIVQTGHRKS